jgi:hypothetical protein
MNDVVFLKTARQYEGAERGASEGVPPPFLNISHIDFGTEIKKHTFKKKYIMSGWD